MRIGFHGALLSLLIFPVFAAQVEVVDRMVAVVNKQVILQSELDQAARVEFLLQGKPLDQLTDAAVRGVLDRLIDQTLLRQQIAHTEVLDPNPEELASRLREVRSQIPGAEDEGKWRTMLAGYGVTERDVGTQLISQIRIVRFIDLRFRGLVSVDKAAVASYYQEKLLPELRKHGAPEPPLNQVAERIEKIVVEQRIDELLADWLQTLRSQSHIEKISEAGAPWDTGAADSGPAYLKSLPAKPAEGSPTGIMKGAANKSGAAKTNKAQTGATAGVKTGAKK